MNRSTLPTQEPIDSQLIEEASQFEQVPLGEGTAVCEVCGEELREGAPVVVFAFRSIEQPAFEIGHVKCTDCRHEPTEFFTLGVCELILDGRIGMCTESELRRVYNRAQDATSGMDMKDDVWREQCRAGFVRALQAQMAARDGDVPMPGGESA